MTRGERLTYQGYEVALFPCDTLFVTQGEHDVLALDFGPRDVNGNVISPMNLYASFSGTIVYTGNDHNCILESDNPVWLANGELRKLRCLVAHSEYAPVLNTHYNQGDLFYTTGNYGFSFGEHLHMEIAYAEGSYWNSGGVGLNNAIHMWEGFYVNDTRILISGGFPWLNFEGGITPPTPEEEIVKDNFPWVLYSKKINKRRRR